MRVEGVGETLIAPTQLTTTTQPVVNGSEGSCAGTSGLGALQLATGGDWSGKWYGEPLGYLVETIEGEGETVGSSKYYWSFWVNDTYEESEGPCTFELQAGDRVLFFPICYESCPAGAEPTPLEIEAPESAAAGEAVDVTVKQYAKSGQASPAAGAEISWSGGSAVADSQGHALLSFPTGGSYELHVSGSQAGPPAVRTEATICIGTLAGAICSPAGGAPPSGSSGSTATASTSQSGSALASAAAPYTGPYAVVARATGIIDGHVYPRARAPRLLTGVVTAPTAISSVEMELRRTYRGRCYAYSGVRARFQRARCGHGSFFAVAHESSFSYLLPAPLAPGRYVLDLRASDTAGSRTTLARGTSRIVFYVR